MTLIGAVILVIPYAIVAAPMALLHRWLLLRIFGSFVSRQQDRAQLRSRLPHLLQSD
jgi:hypothetical protein